MSTAQLFEHLKSIGISFTKAVECKDSHYWNSSIDGDMIYKSRWLGHLIQETAKLVGE